MKVSLLLFISLVICGEVEKYTFINKFYDGQIINYKHDFMLSFDVPGAGEVRQGFNYSILQESLGKKDAFFLIRSTISNIVSINSYGSKLITDFDASAINNISCMLFINDDGELDHIETEDKYNYLEEKFYTHYMGMDADNYKYPFGQNAVGLSVGDSWTVVQDSIKFYLGDGSIESIMSDSSIYTLKKVKLKKGREIAYIGELGYLTCEVRMIIGSEFMDGVQSGTFKSTHRYDIGTGEMILDKGSGSMLGEFKIVDAEFKTLSNFTHKTKRVK